MKKATRIILKVVDYKRRSSIWETIANFSRVGYSSSKDGTKVPIFHLVGGEFIEIVQVSSLDTLPQRTVNGQAAPDHILDALSQELIVCRDLIKLFVQYEKAQREWKTNAV